MAIGIEVPHGAVVDTLLEHGFAVFSLNPKHDLGVTFERVQLLVQVELAEARAEHSVLIGRELLLREGDHELIEQRQVERRR